MTQTHGTGDGTVYMRRRTTRVSTAQAFFTLASSMAINWVAERDMVHDVKENGEMYEALAGGGDFEWLRPCGTSRDSCS